MRCLGHEDTNQYYFIKLHKANNQVKICMENYENRKENKKWHLIPVPNKTANHI